ncbi:uncharacterized protein [Drosophila bipectinata]|uniref:uncharacterized protein n=1 Tax=Drosophila bipectinata TaxID=42026 RepID=UPI001C8AEAE3|nr:uncharacterized protein LOC108133385 [Drosophila bipectinata]
MIMTSAEQLQGCLDEVCGLPDQRSSAASSSYEGFYFGFCTLVSHILLAGITGAIVYKCLVLKLVHTAGHAFYCTIAFVFFMGEALLIRNSKYLESWIGSLNLNRLHAVLGLLAFFVGVGGIAIKTLQKLERKREDPNATVRHFKSNHGFYGIIGCGLLLGSVVTGLPLYFVNAGLTLKLIHRFFGLAGFLALMVSQMFGYNTGFGRRQWKPQHQKLFKFFTFIATILTVNYELRRFAKDVISLTTNYVFASQSAHTRDDL